MDYLQKLDTGWQRLAAAMQKAFGKASTGLTLAEIQVLYESGDAEALVSAVDWKAFEDAYRKYVLPELERMATLGAKAGADVMPFDTEWLLLDPIVENTILTYGGDLIVQITQAQREAVNAFILDSYQKGRGPAAAARSIKDVVGLAPRDAIAVSNFEAAVDKVFDGRRTAEAVRNQYRLAPAIRGNKEAVKARYRDRMLRHRAERIARTETAFAYHRGQRAVWSDLKTQGVYTNEVLEWITVMDDRRCQICEPMHGQQIDLSLGFTTGGGNIVEIPPAHVMCRCDVRIVIDRASVNRELLAAFQTQAA